MASDNVKKLVVGRISKDLEDKVRTAKTMIYNAISGSAEQLTNAGFTDEEANAILHTIVERAMTEKD